MNSVDLIKGKVAKIVDSREMVINVGQHSGVTIDMRFNILSPKRQDIKDPDSQEIIGSIERVKIRVKVTKVHDQISIARTYRKRKVNVGGVGTLPSIDSWRDIIDPPKWIDQTEIIKTRESTLEQIKEQEDYVKIGDLVVQVLGDDDDM